MGGSARTRPERLVKAELLSKTAGERQFPPDTEETDVRGSPAFNSLEPLFKLLPLENAVADKRSSADGTEERHCVVFAK